MGVRAFRDLNVCHAKLYNISDVKYMLLCTMYFRLSHLKSVRGWCEGDASCSGLFLDRKQDRDRFVRIPRSRRSQDYLQTIIESNLHANLAVRWMISKVLCMGDGFLPGFMY